MDGRDLRLSYLLAVDELGVYAKRGYTKYACFGKNLRSKYNKVIEAGKVLGLDLILRPAHANRILDRSEKERIWKDLISEKDAETKSLFTHKDSNGIAYYKHLDRISSSTILTREKADTLIDEGISSGLRTEEQTALQEVFDSPSAKKGMLFHKLYTLKGNLEEQEKIYNEHAKEYGIDSKYRAKLGFLELDSDLKRPFFYSIIKDAAEKRLSDVQKQLEGFCGMDFENSDTNGHEKMQTLFWSMAKQQNQLNKMAGIQGSEVIDKVMDKVGEMSDGEWKDMGIGFLAAGLAIGAILVGSACTAATLGLCTPLSAGMIGLGVGALYTQGTLASREYERKKNSLGFEKQVAVMEDLGFANMGDSYNVSRSWGWTIF